MISYPRWVHWELVKIIKEGELRLDIIDLQTEQIKEGLKVEVALDSVISAQKALIENEKLTSGNWEGRYNNQVGQTRKERSKKNKWKAASFGACAVIVLMFIFSP